MMPLPRPKLSSMPIVRPWKRKSGTSTGCDPESRLAGFPAFRTVSHAAVSAKQLLGAGGFGTAFLCHDRNFNDEVVVKTLHDAAMERNMTEVFREAQFFGNCNIPPSSACDDCDYADPLKHGSSLHRHGLLPWRQSGEFHPAGRHSVSRRFAGRRPPNRSRVCRLPISKTSCTGI